MNSAISTNWTFTDIINLGRYCQVGMFLKNKFPFYKPTVFDNMWSDDLATIPDLITNNFSTFFDRNNIKEKGKNPFGSYTVVDELTKIISVHDIKGLITDDVWDHFKAVKNEVIQNTVRRIKFERFPLFIRVNKKDETKENIEKLRQSLVECRGNDNFSLLIFQQHEPFLGLPRNVIYFMDYTWTWRSEKYLWEGDVDKWNNIFDNIRILQGA